MQPVKQNTCMAKQPDSSVGYVQRQHSQYIAIASWLVNESSLYKSSSIAEKSFNLKIAILSNQATWPVA